jgi:DNA repair ATPase RecN
MIALISVEEARKRLKQLLEDIEADQKELQELKEQIARRREVARRG